MMNESFPPPEVPLARRRAAVALFAAAALAAALPGAARAGEPENRRPAGNLVQNPGFAEGLEHWAVEPLGDTPVVAPAIDPGVSRTGRGASLKLPTEAGKRTVVRQIGIPRDPRVKRYRFSVWTRARGVPADWMARFGIQSSADGRAWRTFQNRHVSCAIVRNWGRTVIQFEPPPGTRQMAVYVSTWFDEAPAPAPPAQGAAVWFDDVSLAPVQDEETLRRAAKAPARIAVESFHPLGQRGLFRAGETIRLPLAVKHNGTTPAALEIAIEVKDFDSVSVTEQTERAVLAGGAVLERTIELPAPPTRGFFCARATVKENGRQVAQSATGFCVIEPVNQRDPFFGIDPNGLTPDLLEALRWIGVGSLGIHAWWGVPKEALGDVKGYVRAQVKKQLSPYLESDFNLVGYLKIDPGFHPGWVQKETLARRRKGLFPYPDALLEVIGDVAEAEAMAMKDRVRTWIIQEEIDAWVNNPNAPAGSGTCELARHVLMTRIAYERLKKVDPGFVVAGLSVCGDYRGDPPYQLVRRVMPELRGHLDLLAPDVYCGAYDFTRDVVTGPEVGRLRQALLATRRVQAASGMGKELIIAEKGLGVAYHAPPDGPTNKAMADYTARNLIVARSAAPVKLYSHYLSAGSSLWHIQKRGYPSDDDNPVTDFGMWKRTMDGRRRQHYQPRPVVAAYATVARVLAGTDEPAELPVRDELYCYLFRKKGRTVAALWTTAGGPCPLRIAMPAASEHWDLMGNVRALAAGEVEITASESPLFLVVRADRDAVAAAIKKAVLLTTGP